MRDPDTSRFFFFFYAKAFSLSEKLCDYGITRPRGTLKRRRAHWAVLVLGCIWLFVLHTRFHRAFRSVFRCVSDNMSDNVCIVCTQTAFFVKKQKALGDFQIIFQINFALFVPDLTGMLEAACGRQPAPAKPPCAPYNTYQVHR